MKATTSLKLGFFFLLLAVGIAGTAGYNLPKVPAYNITFIISCVAGGIFMGTGLRMNSSKSVISKTIQKNIDTTNSNLKGIKLSTLLIKRNLKFKEQNTRLNYGLIGHVINKRTNECSILIFEGCFYVLDRDLAMNSTTLEIIDLIRELYTELSRDAKGKITPVILNE